MLVDTLEEIELDISEDARPQIIGEILFYTMLKLRISLSL